MVSGLILTRHRDLRYTAALRVDDPAYGGCEATVLSATGAENLG